MSLISGSNSRLVIAPDEVDLKVDIVAKGCRVASVLNKSECLKDEDKGRS